MEDEVIVWPYKFGHSARLGGRIDGPHSTDGVCASSETWHVCNRGDHYFLREPSAVGNSGSVPGCVNHQRI